MVDLVLIPRPESRERSQFLHLDTPGASTFRDDRAAEQTCQSALLKKVFDMQIF
jgi:hypothetical protein